MAGQEKWNALRETENLMREYMALKRYTENGLPEAGGGADWGFQERVRNSKARTSDVVAALDDAMEATKAELRIRGQEYKWQAFTWRYLEGATYEDIAERLSAGRNTPDRWCKEVMQRMAVWLFGVDGLKRW